MIKFAPERFKKGKLFGTTKDEKNQHEMDNVFDPSIPRAEFESDYMNKLY